MNTKIPALSRHLPRAVMLLGWICVIVFALIEIMPFIWALAAAFKCPPPSQIHPRSFIPTPPLGVACETVEGTMRPAGDTSGTLTFNPTFEGFADIFDTQMPRWLFNTAFVAVSVTILRLFLDSLAGYALARMSFRGQRPLFYLTLSTLMVPPIVLIIPRFIILKQFGILNSYAGLIFPAAVDAFGIFLMKQFFEAIPLEVEEAAMVDGATRFEIFRQVILPMSTPALTALAIFSFQGMWNEFLTPLIIVGSDNSFWTIPVGLNFLRGIYGESLPWPTFLAGCVLAILPMLVLYVFFHRYLVQNYAGLKS